MLRFGACGTQLATRLRSPSSAGSGCFCMTTQIVGDSPWSGRRGGSLGALGKSVNTKCAGLKGRGVNVILGILRGRKSREERLQSAARMNCGFGVRHDASKNRLVDPPSSTASTSTLAAHRGHHPTKASWAGFK